MDIKFCGVIIIYYFQKIIVLRINKVFLEDLLNFVVLFVKFERLKGYIKTVVI